MALTYSPTGELGSKAFDFSLPATDGKTYQLRDFAGSKALVIVFMCNHCPYVKAVQGRINQLAKDYLKSGVRVVGINSNDSIRYPDDSFEAMKRVASENGYVFPYLFDETQVTAKEYGAVCTPDFYVYDSDFMLRYRGQLDDSWKDETKITRKDLASSLDLLLKGASLTEEQVPSMGCSIKWKQ